MHITSVVHDSSAFIVTPGAATVGIGDTVTYYVNVLHRKQPDLFIDTLKFYHDASGSPYALPLYGEGHVPAPISLHGKQELTLVRKESVRRQWIPSR